MTKVFIGGSRRISRINEMVRKRLDTIMAKHFPVLIGDANGADKAVQSYLLKSNYAAVEVFCMARGCRNNLGNWPTRVISATPDKRGFDYFSLKDEEMTKESSVGLMLWDGTSRGTLTNVSRMVRQHKPVVVYVAPKRIFETVKTEADLDRFTAHNFGQEHQTVGKITKSVRSKPNRTAPERAA
jgi:hypothetical protein